MFSPDRTLDDDAILSLYISCMALGMDPRSFDAPPRTMINFLRGRLGRLSIKTRDPNVVRATLETAWRQAPGTDARNKRVSALGQSEPLVDHSLLGQLLDDPERLESPSISEAGLRIDSPELVRQIQEKSARIEELERELRQTKIERDEALPPWEPEEHDADLARSNEILSGGMAELARAIVRLEEEKAELESKLGDLASALSASEEGRKELQAEVKKWKDLMEPGPGVIVDLSQQKQPSFSAGFTALEERLLTILEKRGA